MSEKTYNTHQRSLEDTKVVRITTNCDSPQLSTNLYPPLPSDPLRREFLAECLDHVSRVAYNASNAIVCGNDRLYEIQIELMRTTMREAMRTYAELAKEGGND